MNLFDSDHVSLLHRDGAEGRRIQAKIVASSEPIALCIVTYEEQMRGWLAEIAKTLPAPRQKPIYARLNEMLEIYCATPLLPFDDAAIAIYENLLRQRVGIGTMDLKIAAIALANDATLLTRNLSDFSKVPGLRIEDWAV